MLLSILVPVFNEKATIHEILRRVEAVPIEKHLIIIDDFSTDGTREILQEEIQPAHPDWTFLFHDRNRGKGAALRTGIPHIRGDYVIVQDADLEYDPNDYQLMLKPVRAGKAEVVYGSRFTGEHRNLMYFHWLGNRFLTLTTNILYNTTLSDMETCYKLFRSDILKNLTLHSDSFDIEPEITAKILKQGLRIYEVPISYAGREFHEGKKITWRDGFVALWTLLWYRFAN